MTGTSPRASVSDTKVWQLAVLPSAEAYCAATPTECVPFLGIAVSSITSTASSPPTSLSAWISSSVSTMVRRTGPLRPFDVGVHLGGAGARESLQRLGKRHVEFHRGLISPFGHVWACAKLEESMGGAVNPAPSMCAYRQ